MLQLKKSYQLNSCFFDTLFCLPIFVRQDHSIYMSSVLQVQQLYAAGIPLLETY